MFLKLGKLGKVTKNQVKIFIISGVVEKNLEEKIKIRQQKLLVQRAAKLDL